MHLSRESKIICGVLLILVPTIVYGGITLLGIVTQGSAGMSPGDLSLSETQRALWRAGHAHAGVFVILAILLQLLVDQATLSKSFKWLARLGAPIASVLVPAGFFGLAFVSGFKWIIYFGAVSLATSMLLTGIGLIKRPSASIAD